MHEVSKSLKKDFNAMLLNVSCAEMAYSYTPDRYGYQNELLTIFDHWLTEKEADQLSLSYPVIMSKNQKNIKDYLFQEEKFLSFCAKLYNTGDVYYCRDDHEGSNEFHTFSSKKEFLEILKNNLREIKFSFFFLKEFNILMLGNFDLSMHVFYNKNTSREKFKHYVFDSGLFLLTS